MKNIVFLLTALLFLTSACQDGWYVDKKPIPEQKKDAVAYYLPKHQVHLTIELKKAHFVPGPYAEFANLYLSLSNVEVKEKHFYSVNKVEYHVSVLPDPDRKFWVIPEKSLPDLSFNQQGILSGINVENASEKITVTDPVMISGKLPNPANPDFTNLQIDKSKYEVIDTTYRVVQRDSIVKRIPVYNTKEKEKTVAQKAQDAADFIIRIRKNRFSLEAALEEQKVSGVDIAYMIEKLEALEQSYLELFTGKLKTESVQLHYTITPEKNQDVQRFVLDYLDKNSGEPVEQNDNADKLEVLLLPLYRESAETIEAKQEKNKKSLVFYQAKPVELVLFKNDKKVFFQQAVIPQMGTLRYLPASMINKDSQIKLDPHTGEIIFIK